MNIGSHGMGSHGWMLVIWFEYWEVVLSGWMLSLSSIPKVQISLNVGRKHSGQKIYRQSLVQRRERHWRLDVYSTERVCIKNYSGYKTTFLRKCNNLCKRRPMTYHAMQSDLPMMLLFSFPSVALTSTSATTGACRHNPDFSDGRINFSTVWCIPPKTSAERIISPMRLFVL